MTPPTIGDALLIIIQDNFTQLFQENLVQTASKRRVWVIAIAMIAAMLIVTARLVQLQVVQTEELKQLGDGMRTEVKDTTPERGQILDKTATSLRHQAVIISLGRTAMDYKAGSGQLATALAPILQQPRYEILEKLLLEQQHVRLSDHFLAADCRRKQ